MKLRISSCKTALAKDLTRFAPAWGLYLIGLLMLLIPNLVDYDPDTAAMTLGEAFGALGVLNFLYAALCAQLLFGDLFQSRLCNALHAMPLKRGDWFFSHVAAGLSFSLVPNTVCALVIMQFLEEFWFVSLFWLGAMTLEFLFFFGLAVLSVFCVGSRFAMVAVYGILNFLSLLALWFAKTVFEPLLFGLYVSAEPFYVLSPVVQLAMGQEYICFERLAGDWVFTGLGDGWGYLLILAGIGLGLGALALLLYRRRALETAGDFMAVRSLAPVFCAVYTLTVVALFAAMGELFMGEMIYFFPIGFLVGFFTSQMLLRRTVKVFTRKVFLWFGIFAGVLAACVALLILDPTGYSRWIPEPSQVVKVEISDNLPDEWLYNGLYRDAESLELEDPADIAAIVELHRQVTEKRGDFPSKERTVSLQMVYTLQNGDQVTRVYENCVPAQPLAEFFSRPECVLGLQGDQDAFIAGVPYVHIEHGKITGEHVKELLQAIIADCEAGTMAQGPLYHDYNKELVVTWVDFLLTDGTYRELMIYSGAENTARWLKENFDLWGDENTKLEDYFYGKLS
ncbi:MAG: hypothetical protein IJA45_09300 [Oscillospiraceae bacterium]|nr:hypothetical protein [Oscillospiraceae bacterium]